MICLHRKWEIVGPVGVGRTYSVAWCRCVRCGASRQRVLSGREADHRFDPVLTNVPEPAGLPPAGG